MAAGKQSPLQIKAKVTLGHTWSRMVTKAGKSGSRGIRTPDPLIKSPQKTFKYFDFQPFFDFSPAVNAVQRDKRGDSEKRMFIIRFS